MHEIFNFESASSFLRASIEEKKKKNSKFSLRAFSANADISVSSLSLFLNRKKGLSNGSALKLSKYLKLKEDESDYFFTLIQLESSISEEVQDMLLEKLNFLKKNTPPTKGTDIDLIKSKIKDLYENTQIDQTFHYSLPDTTSSRILTKFKYRSNGRAHSAFQDTFISSERLVASSSYFFKNEDGTYQVYLSEMTNGELNPTLQNAENLNLKITFDPDGLPKIENLFMKTLGTNCQTKVDLTFSKKNAIQDGWSFDVDHPKIKTKVYRIYNRKF